jgi:hypothetical protein
MIDYFVKLGKLIWSMSVEGGGDPDNTYLDLFAEIGRMSWNHWFGDINLCKDYEEDDSVCDDCSEAVQKRLDTISTMTTTTAPSSTDTSSSTDTTEPSSEESSSTTSPPTTDVSAVVTTAPPSTDTPTDIVTLPPSTDDNTNAIVITPDQQQEYLEAGTEFFIIASSFAVLFAAFGIIRFVVWTLKQTYNLIRIIW